jgi:hypothetical protein
MAYTIAGIDVHKKVLAVVVAEVAGDGEYEFERRRLGSHPEQLQLLSQGLIEQPVEEVGMESTAQYWQPVGGALERYWRPRWQSRKVRARGRERCIWRKRNPIADGAGGRRISQMPSDGGKGG